MENLRLIWECENCGDVVVSYSRIRHDMNSCECKKSAVDLEEFYRRDMGYVKDLSLKKKVGDEWVKIK